MLTVAISKRNKLQNIIVLTPKDGSTMCNELSKMQKDGMIEYKKNHILLKD